MTKKDLTRFFNSPPYMMNAGLGLLYAIGMAAVTAFSGNDLAKNILENGAKFQNPAAYMTVIAAFMISFFAAMTTISGCSVSVEARSLWILKSMPVRAKEVLTGKLLSHLVLAVPASLICSTIYLFTTPELTVPGVVLMFLMPVAFNILNALLGLIGNLYYGKLDYPSIAKAAKSTSGALIPLLAIMLLVGGAVALYFILFREMIEVTVYGFIVTAAALIADLCLYSFLGSKAAQKRWDKLGQ